MIKPRVDKLLEHTDTHYAAVLVAAKRARQINSYYHRSREGASASTRRRWSRFPAANYLTIALEETAAGQAQVRVQGLAFQGGLDGPHPARGERRDRRL